jgi:hypothetical protein
MADEQASEVGSTVLPLAVRPYSGVLLQMFGEYETS